MNPKPGFEPSTMGTSLAPIEWKASRIWIKLHNPTNAEAVYWVFIGYKAFVG
jgi:hypothetical protein